MHIKTDQRVRHFRWKELFLPEDTASEFQLGPPMNRKDGFWGCLKFWLWIAISIMISLAIGQL